MENTKLDFFMKINKNSTLFQQDQKKVQMIQVSESRNVKIEYCQQSYINKKFKEIKSIHEQTA